MKEGLPEAVRSSEFTLFGVRVRCYVLDDGQRVIDADDLQALFAAMERPESQINMSALEPFSHWIGLR
jgi:hypothetical protein